MTEYSKNFIKANPWIDDINEFTKILTLLEPGIKNIIFDTDSDDNIITLYNMDKVDEFNKFTLHFKVTQKLIDFIFDKVIKSIELCTLFPGSYRYMEERRVPHNIYVNEQLIYKSLLDQVQQLREDSSANYQIGILYDDFYKRPYIYMISNSFRLEKIYI